MFSNNLLAISESEKLEFEVLYVFTKIDVGCSTPIAKLIWTSTSPQTPEATRFFAICLAAYAALRSTFEGSFPLNAPPPCAPFPPYVSTTIFLPVRPVSPWGPPITNLPVGLIK